MLTAPTLPDRWDVGLTPHQIDAVLKLETEFPVVLPADEYRKGYLRVRLRTFHPYANQAGQQLLHRYVMMRYLRRRLRSWEHVHHKVLTLNPPCRAPLDTRNPDHLEVLEEVDHARFHFGRWRECGPHLFSCIACHGLGCGTCAGRGVFAA